MTAADLVAALQLPATCQVDQRVPKKMLVEHGAPTAADRRLINSAVEEVRWAAALKPNTVGVPPWSDEKREYLEIAVLQVTTRSSLDSESSRRAPKRVNTARLAELIHRAVPYPVLLLLSAPQGLSMSGAHKRWALNEADKVVLDGDLIDVALADEASATLPAFLSSLALARQPQSNLWNLYQGWLDRLIALQAGSLTGRFVLAKTRDQAELQHAALNEHRQLQQEEARLRSQASKEKQLARQVKLNLSLQRVRARLAEIQQQLETIQ